MALQVISSDSIGAGIRVTLGTTDDVFITAGTNVISTTNRVINGTGSDHTVTVDGFVANDSTQAISLGDDAGDSDNTLIVGATGVVRSNPSFFSTVLLLGSDSLAINHGEITGTQPLFFGLGAENSTVINTGNITSTGSSGAAVWFDDDATGTNSVRNTGYIDAFSGLAFSSTSATSQDDFTNTGHVYGDIELGGGTDIYDGKGGGLVLGDVKGQGGDDRLMGSAEIDVFKGGGGDDVLLGRGGNDTLEGGVGDDDIRGGRGDDLIDGGAGNDRIHGGRDDDVIDGGLGRDIMTGGRGNDTIVLTSVDHSTDDSNADRITDFKQGDDLIDLRSIDAQSGNSGDQAFSFIGTSGFSGTEGELRATTSGSNVAVRGDIDGDGNADFKIIVEDLDSLSVSDFIL